MNTSFVSTKICEDRTMAEPRIPSDLLPSDPRFGCGPSRIRREVVASLSEPGSVMGTSHRQPPVRHVVAAIREELSTLYDLPAEYEVALGNGGATLFWDMATVSLVEKCAATGVYGEFTKKFSSVLQGAPFLADPAVFQAPPGELALPQALGEIDAYAWAHNETSTGVVAPIRRPDEIDENSLVLVDATSAVGGVAADVAQTDAYYFSPQKNLSSDGGLWLAILSPAAIERSERLTTSARWVPQMLDLSVAVKNSRADQTLNTPALATLVMLEAQCRWLLDKGGMTWAASRTASTSGILYRWAEDNPLTTPFVADPALRSPVVVTIDIDKSVDATQLCARARENGILDIEPYRKLGRNQIRVATFSSIEPGDIEALTACLDWLLEHHD
ncbi:phosphoserine transaminase [Cutibacterium avidum]|uniref:phosphoserine transaminase n=2 Tax=Cutibacterium avidum TaxID=33010 RepID=G4CYA5_9ACTN|nr:phosphoserine transaminase [Cutibacterium avidum]EGY77969.1 phosphoserine transaminase [Cutibacterium avidum ATCC 25577]QRH10481.1 phosphoserine transaminase [Cutibacterium avidum]